MYPKLCPIQSTLLDLHSSQKVFAHTHTHTRTHTHIYIYIYIYVCKLLFGIHSPPPKTFHLHQASLLGSISRRLQCASDSNKHHMERLFWNNLLGKSPSSCMQDCFWNDIIVISCAPYRIQNPSDPQNTPQMHPESSPETKAQKNHEKYTKIGIFVYIY